VGFLNDSIKNYIINMHPGAFQDFTDILKDFKEMNMWGRNQVAYYEARDTVLENKIVVKCMFPTVLL